MAARDVRTFDGTDDGISLSAGNLVGMTYGTVLAVVRITNVAYRSFIGVGTTGFSDILGLGNDNSTQWYAFSQTDYSLAAGAPTVADGWVIAGMTKTAGASAPIFYKYVFGTSTWTNTNGNSMAAMSGTLGLVCIGRSASFQNYWQGDIAGAAIWKDTVLTGPQIQSLVANWDAWQALSPTAMWVLNQGSTATSITDLTGGGASQTALTGTTVTAGTAPIDFGVPLDQEGFRWRNDDGSETAATWAAAQDTDLTAPLATNVRLRTLVNVTNPTDDPPSTAFALRYKKSTDSLYLPVPTSSALTTAFGNLGTAPVATATNTIDIAYPSPVAAGDLILCAIASRLGSTSIDAEGFSALANNTQNVATSEGTAGTEAADTGGVRITVFYKVATGSEAGNVTFSNAGTAALSQNGRMLSFTKPSWATWDLADASGKLATGALAYVAAMGTNPGIAIGDILVACSAFNTDAPTFSAETVTGTGLTTALTTEHVDAAGTGGNDTRLVITQHSVSAALTSGVPTYNATASAGTPEGATVLTRIRAAGAPPIVMSASANITAGGEATTAQLTAPSGKTTGDFTTGRMWDDENGADPIDIGLGKYTEFERCLQAQFPAVATDIYQFREYRGTAALDTYAVTPQWTIGTSGGGGTGGFKLGTTDITALKIGTTTATKLMVGTTQVWP